MISRRKGELNVEIRSRSVFKQDFLFCMQCSRGKLPPPHPTTSIAHSTCDAFIIPSGAVGQPVLLSKCLSGLSASMQHQSRFSFSPCQANWLVFSDVKRECESSVWRILDWVWVTHHNIVDMNWFIYHDSKYQLLYFWTVEVIRASSLLLVKV